MPLKQCNCTSPTPPARLTFPPYSPPLRLPVIGRLLHLKSSTGSHLRPWCILYYSSVQEVAQQVQSFCWIKSYAKFQSMNPVHKKLAVMTRVQMY